jgi:hypothetical protein
VLLPAPPAFRKLLKTGPSELTLSWTQPAEDEGLKSYLLFVTAVLPSEDNAFFFEVVFNECCELPAALQMQPAVTPK